MATLTVTLPNGTIAKRRTERTYTHAVITECHYENGRVSFSKPEWAGRLELAQKNAAKHEAREAAYMACATLPEGWNRLASYRVHIIPVNP